MEVDMSTSLTSVEGIMIVSLSGEMTDNDLKVILENVTEYAYKNDVKGVILNFSAVSMLDSYLFKSFKDLTSALALLGVKSIWVGLKPGVVSAIMDLGLEIDIKKITTAINLDDGIKMLKQ